MMETARTNAIAEATAWFDSGGLLPDLSRRVGFRTESQIADRADSLIAYLRDEIAPAMARLGFRASIWTNPVDGAPPMLFAERLEDPALATVLIYGHGDVVPGHDPQWSDGRSPWELTVAGGRWYGRGT